MAVRGFQTLRWRIAVLLDKLPGQCWADLVSWAAGSRDRWPWFPQTDTCRRDAADGGCYCGKLRTADQESDIPEPCQPIGCDNGYHLPGCVFAAADAEDDSDDSGDFDEDKWPPYAEIEARAEAANAAEREQLGEA